MFLFWELVQSDEKLILGSNDIMKLKRYCLLIYGFCVSSHFWIFAKTKRDDETHPIGIPRVLSVRRVSLWTTTESASLVRTKVPPRA